MLYYTSFFGKVQEKYGPFFVYFFQDNVMINYEKIN